jgi:Putative auto-transporter adhesin, head GIN domain
MRKLMFTGLALAALALPAAAEIRDVSNFTNVSASGRYRVEVEVGPEFRVEASGADAARIRTRVEGDTLKIEPINRPWFGNPRYQATFRVTLPRLEGVAAARGMTMVATAGGDCDDFSAASAMGSDLVVREIACDTVDAAAAMGADLTLSGACGSLDATAAMGADLRAGGLQCRTVDASAAMGADIRAFASVTYDATASMGADVEVTGGGRARDSRASMGGSVSHID